MEPRRKFKFLKEIAAGGFGKVYLAEMITGDNFSSVVAIKLLHTKWSSNDEIVMRSRDEARLLGRLRHRNIVRVENLTKINGQIAIVMEYLQGVDLKATCVHLKDRDRTFPRKSAFEAIGAVASALDAAYNHRPLQGGEPLKVIHRDIKPSNAMITVEGDVKVLDFGTARASFEEREAKTQVLAFGSQAYMAPERMLGEPDTPAADIFSLGITLYELLTCDSFGKIHLRQERYEPILDERLDAMPLDPMPESMKPEVVQALRLMLAYEPTNRPAAADVVELMESFADRANDTGLKRFARETVKEILDTQYPEPDPNDPYTGTEMSEDTSGVSDRRGGLTETIPPPDDDSDDAFRPPPELAERVVDLPKSRPSAEVSASAAFSGPPVPPRVTSARPIPAVSTAGRDSGSAAVALAEEPRNAEVSAPKSRLTTRETSAPRPIASSEADEPPPSGGGGLKVMIGLAMMALVGSVLAGGVFVFVSQSGGETTVETPPTPPKPPADKPAPSNLPTGSDEVDWSPNERGKAGAILQVPAGAQEVTITSSMGFRTEWDGAGNLRLKDLEPGTYRGKVKPQGGGSSVLADFAVEPGKTCIFSFGASGAWEKGECR